MPSRCRYVSADGEEIELDGPDVWVGTANNLRRASWGHELGYRSIAGVVREAREADVDAAFLDPSEADRLRRAADRDVARGTPGKVWVDDWFQRAYVVEVAPSEVYPGWMRASLAVALLDGVWSRWHKAEFRASADEASDGWLDLPTDCPFDLMPARGESSIVNPANMAGPARLTFWGAAVSPYVVIGNNRYAVDATVPDGARVVADGTAYPRTIELVARNGDATDLFSAGVRGSGKGSGEYIFEDIAPGWSGVSWPGGYGVDVEWLEQEGAPPCP